MKYYLTLLASLLFINIHAQKIVVLDQDAGAAYLSDDPYDHFFDLVQPLDIAIQLQDEGVLQMSRDEVVRTYQESFKEEATDFTEPQAERLYGLFDSLCTNVREINEKLLPDTVYLIALNGDHYGQGAFYTRGKAIAIPQATMRTMPPRAFEYVMYHELFHLLSRKNADLRHQLYAKVGYAPIDHLIYHPSIAPRILLNPDGVNTQYRIGLQTDTSTAELEYYAPIIYSTQEKLDPGRTTFFSYLDFKLVRIYEKDGQWHTDDYTSLEKQVMEVVIPAYFGRIGMNTQYIIHPDEILADNFMYLFRSEEENQGLDHGLLDIIRTTLTAY